MYKRIFRSLLAHWDAETAHDRGLNALTLAMRMPGLRRLCARLLCARDPRLVVHAFGCRFSNPVGLAAGFDKEARHFEDLAALGFGFVEVGTATAYKQVGNPRPR